MRWPFKEKQWASGQSPDLQDTRGRRVSEPRWDFCISLLNNSSGAFGSDGPNRPSLAPCDFRAPECFCLPHQPPVMLPCRTRRKLLLILPQNVLSCRLPISLTTTTASFHLLGPEISGLCLTSPFVSYPLSFPSANLWTLPSRDIQRVYPFPSHPHLGHAGSDQHHFLCGL